MIEEYVKLALKGINGRRIRAWLTMIGIFIGIASVTALISLGDGVNNFMQSQFASIGADKIMVIPGGGEGLAGLIGGFLGGSSTLTEEDVELISKVAGIKDVSFMIYGYDKITKRDEAESVFIAGVPTGKDFDMLKQMQGIEVVRGRTFQENEKNVALVGYLWWSGDQVLRKPLRLRDTITIKDEEFEVIGFLSKVGNKQDDANVYIPLETARDLFSKPDDVDTIIAQVHPSFEPSTVAELVKTELRQEKNQKEGEEDFSVQTLENLAKQVGLMISIVQLVFIGVSGISLVVGGVGIMNTMYTSVMERTREIGIMKAIGAKNNQILAIFLIESGIYGLVGGVVGGLTGIAVSKLVELAVISSQGAEIFKVRFSVSLLLFVLAFSFGVGVVSGLLPAKQASEMQPVDALRYE